MRECDAQGVYRKDRQTASHLEDAEERNLDPRGQPKDASE